MTDTTPSILVLGSRLQSDGYPRNRELVDAMADAGWDLRWCALPYPGFYHRLNLPLRLAFIVLFTPLRWLYSLVIGAAHRLRGPVSHVFVPFPTLLDLPPAWLIARLNGARLVADVFLGTYNTLVEDRRVVAKGSLPARVLFHTERLLLRLPDKSLIDTREHQALLEALFDSRSIHFAVVPIAVDEMQFTFSPPPQSDKVVFWGTYIKLHGVETIVRAASRLDRAGSRIRFEMIGNGQELHRAKQLAAKLYIQNMEFIEKILPIEAVIGRARGAFAALGIFGNSEKSASVFPYKALQALALGLPLVTAATPASERLLVHERDALLVPPGDPEGLANALERLHGDRALVLLLSRNGRDTYERNFSRRHIVATLRAVFGDKDIKCTTPN